MPLYYGLKINCVPLSLFILWKPTVSAMDSTEKGSHNSSMHEQIAVNLILGSKDSYCLFVQRLACDLRCFTLNPFLECLNVLSDFCISYFLLLLQNILPKHLQEGKGYFASVFEGTDHHDGECVATGAALALRASKDRLVLWSQSQETEAWMLVLNLNYSLIFFSFLLNLGPCSMKRCHLHLVWILTLQ